MFLHTLVYISLMPNRSGSGAVSPLDRGGR